MKKEQKTEPEFCMKPEAVRNGLYTLRTQCIAGDIEPHIRYECGEWGKGVHSFDVSVRNLLRDAERLIGSVDDLQKENKAMQEKIDQLELENGEYKFAFMSMPTWLNSKMVEVIRCKDCEYSVQSSEGFVLCTAPFARSYPQDFKPVDWFCAGGKKRKDNTSDMKYRDIYRKAAMVIGEENIDDYRPADTPNSITIWLKNGDTLTYHAKDGGDVNG